MHPDAQAYIRYATWEEKHKQVDRARKVYERALGVGNSAEEDDEDDLQAELSVKETCDPRIWTSFAKFETRAGEDERGRALFAYAIEYLTEKKRPDAVTKVQEAQIIFEKQRGEKEGVENAVVMKRSAAYERQVEEDAWNYDAWIDLANLWEGNVKDQQDTQGLDKVREVYARAQQQVPEAQEKDAWRRFIYVFIRHAIFEETVAKQVEATRAVYKAGLDVIPHAVFSFSKMWILAAHFEVRQRQLTAARRVLGTGIGKRPSPKLFRAYLQLELQLGEGDRCRKLYEKWLEFQPHSCLVWTRYAGLEASLNEVVRARTIFELGVSQPFLDMPETLWKAFIDFEVALTSEDSVERALALYTRLLEKTSHVKVWLSYAKFAFANFSDKTRGRAIFQEAYDTMKTQTEQETGDAVLALRAARSTLLEGWLEVEEAYMKLTSDPTTVDKVQAMLPTQVKLLRTLPNNAGVEEYFDYKFPDDPKAATGLSILELANQWKKKAAA